MVIANSLHVVSLSVLLQRGHGRMVCMLMHSACNLPLGSTSNNNPDHHPSARVEAKCVEREDSGANADDEEENDEREIGITDEKVSSTFMLSQSPLLGTSKIATNGRGARSAAVSNSAGHSCDPVWNQLLVVETDQRPNQYLQVNNNECGRDQYKQDTLSATKTG